MRITDYEIRPISYAQAMEIVISKHYLKRKAPCSVAFGLFAGDEIKGVICYGTPSSAPLRKGIAGAENARNVVELTRLWVCDSVPKNGESYLIGRTIKMAGKEIVVSFADASMGHVGVVYQATNWIYTGLSAKRTDWTVEGVNRHGQTLADKHSAEEIRAKYGDRFRLKARQRKHRYIYINARGRRKSELIQAIRYNAEPYPRRSERK